MKKIVLLLIGLTVISCNEKPEINLETFLLGEKFCTLPDANQYVCLRFQSDKAYYTTKEGEPEIGSISFKIIKTIQEKNLILLELVGEGVINEFTVIHQDTVLFKQRGLDDPATKLYKVNQ